MRLKLIAMLIAGATGCLDLASLQSGESDMAMTGENPDMRMPDPGIDMTLPADLTPPDDLQPPPDLQPSSNWASVQTSTGKKLNAISGATALAVDTIFAVGQLGTVYRGSGSTFVAATAPMGNPELRALWVSSTLKLWTAAMTGEVFESSDAAVSWANKNTGSAIKLRGIFAKNNSTSDVVAAGEDNTNGLHYNGTNWMNAVHNLTKQVFGVWGSNANFYVVGMAGKSARASDGRAAWTGIADVPGEELQAVSGVDDNNVFVVTSKGKLLKYNAGGNKWDTVVSIAGTPDLAALWVKSTSEIWIAGNSAATGVVYQCDTTLVTPACTTRGTNTLNAHTITGIWGNGSGGIWLTANKGADGFIFKN